MDIPFDQLPDEGLAAQPKPAAVPQQQGSPLSFDALPDDEETYGTVGQQIITGLEGAAQGLAGPLAPLAERALGVDPEGIRLRAETNPWVHGLSEAGGFVGGMLIGTGEAVLLEKAGVGALKAAGMGKAAVAANEAYSAAKLAGRSESVAAAAGRAAASEFSIKSRLADGAVKMGTELALLQAGDEATKFITKDPDQSIGSAVSNIGLSALLGSAAGPAFAGAGMAWGKAASKVGWQKDFADQLTDLQNRFKARSAGLSPTEAMENEVNQTMKTYHDLSSEVAGASGLTREVIEKLIPTIDVGITPKIPIAREELVQGLAKYAQSMQEADVPKNLINKYNKVIEKYLDDITNPNKTDVDAFDAANVLKKDLQNFAKGDWGPWAVKPYAPEYDFLKTVKQAARDVRLHLENPDVWGKELTDLQKGINGAWTKAIPAVKDIESKFMTRVGNELVIDPAKFATYANQNGKATTQNIRQQMMGKFVDAMEKFHSETAKIYEKAGVLHPPLPGMGELKASLGKTSWGTKMADKLYDKVAAQTLGAAAGGSLGGTIGHATGIPYAGLAGAVVGKHFGEQVLPAFIQPLIEKAVSPQGFKTAKEFAEAAMKAQGVLQRGSKNLFRGLETVPQHMMPNEKKIEKLDKQLKELQLNQKSMFNVAGDLGHYMPRHAVSVSSGAMSAVNYLNQARPRDKQSNPLDTPMKPTKMELAAYNRKLSIAQQPMMALKFIERGTLQPQDVETLHRLYPSYYSKMSADLIDAMTEHLAKGNQIPYKIRQSLSLFLGTPLDGTMTPQAIQAAQSVFVEKKMQMEQMQAQSKSGSTKNLGDIAENSMTPQQAKEQHRIQKG